MIRNWSFLEIGGGEVIACGKYGISTAARDFINGLFDQIEKLSKENAELRANKHSEDDLALSVVKGTVFDPSHKNGRTQITEQS